MKSLYFFIFLFSFFQTNLVMGSENYSNEEISLFKNKAARKLLRIMNLKQTLLGVSFEGESLEAILKIIPLIAPHICLLKMCIEQYTDFSTQKIARLKALSKQHNFMILQDSKFADSSPTVKNRYIQATYNIAQWAHFVTVHFVEGSGILEHLKKALKENNIKESRGAFVITQILNLATLDYTKSVLRAIKNSQEENNFLAGIEHITVMPSIGKEILKLESDEISLSKSIQTNEDCLVEAIRYRGSNICILKLSPSDFKSFEKIPQLKVFSWEGYYLSK